MNDSLLNLKINNSDKLKDFQKYIVNDWEEHKFNVLVNSLQIGASTMIAYSAFVNALEGKATGIFVKNQNDASIYLKLVQNLIQINNLKDIISQNTKELIRTITGGYIHIMWHPSYLRGKGFNAIYVDNYDFLDTKIKGEIIKSIMPSISYRTFSKLIIQSTPDPSSDNSIVKFVTDPKFYTNIVNYDIVESRDNDWKNSMIKMIGSELFDEEFDMSKYYHLLQ